MTEKEFIRKLLDEAYNSSDIKEIKLKISVAYQLLIDWNDDDDKELFFSEDDMNQADLIHTNPDKGEDF